MKAQAGRHAADLLGPGQWPVDGFLYPAVVRGHGHRE